MCLFICLDWFPTFPASVLRAGRNRSYTIFLKTSKNYMYQMAIHSHTYPLGTDGTLETRDIKIGSHTGTSIRGGQDGFDAHHLNQKPGGINSSILRVLWKCNRSHRALISGGSLLHEVKAKANQSKFLDFLFILKCKQVTVWFCIF